MANSRTDFQINNENQGATTFHASKNVMDTARKHTVKKQAFGELKNVIHNQPKSLKYEEKPNNIRIIKPKLSSTVKPAFQQHKQLTNVTQTTVRPCTTTAMLENDDAAIELLDYFDFAPSCCTKPYKGDRQIWAEMNAFDDSLIDNLMKSSFIEEEDDKELIEDFGFDDSGCEDLLNFDSSRLFQASRFSEDTEDFFLPPPPAPTDFEDFGNF